MIDRLLQPIGAASRQDLAALFDEEELMWARELSWDFEPTRRRLEAALSEGALSGLVARDGAGPCAYATYALNDGQGLVGSVFASGRSRALGLEGLLVGEILGRLVARRPRVIDCQTLFSSDPGLLEPFSAYGFESADRTYMSLDRESWLRARSSPETGTGPVPIHRLDLRRVARLVHEAHFAARRNDASSSFDTLESCERILRQITEDDICGPFDPRRSRMVERNGELLSLCLLTWPRPGVAHVSEVATAPAYQGKGLARRCLTETLRDAFEPGEATVTTLSVTDSNHAAFDLYRSLGFASRVRYRSHVLRERAPRTPC